MNNFKRTFIQDQHVLVVGLSDGNTYRAFIKGKTSEGYVDFYIVEWRDRPAGCAWSHSSVIETCITPLNSAKHDYFWACGRWPR